MAGNAEVEHNLNKRANTPINAAEPLQGIGGVCGALLVHGRADDAPVRFSKMRHRGRTALAGFFKMKGQHI
jgi:hypothetical protein